MVVFIFGQCKVVHDTGKEVIVTFDDPRIADREQTFAIAKPSWESFLECARDVGMLE